MQGHRERVKTRFESTGGEGFAEHELIELVLFYAIRMQNTNPQAHALAERFGTFDAVIHAPIEELTKVPGIGESSALRLKMVGDMMGYYESHRSSLTTSIQNCEDACRFTKERYERTGMKGNLLLALNTRQGLLAAVPLGKEIDEKVIACYAMDLHSSCMILALDVRDMAETEIHAKYSDAFLEHLNNVMGRADIPIEDYLYVFLDKGQFQVLDAQSYSEFSMEQPSIWK